MFKKKLKNVQKKLKNFRKTYFFSGRVYSKLAVIITANTAGCLNPCTRYVKKLIFTNLLREPIVRCTMSAIV